MERATWTRRVVLLVGAAAAATAVIGGLISSRATAASPSPTSGKVTLKIGWMEPPDNMNPFIGWSNTVYEIYYLEYQRLGGRNVETMQPHPARAHSRAGRSRPTVSPGPATSMRA